MWLEVHKLPKENWTNELDSIIQALKKKEEKREEQAISEGVAIYANSFFLSIISQCHYYLNHQYAEPGCNFFFKHVDSRQLASKYGL